MTEFELSKTILHKIVLEDIPFAKAFNPTFKKEGVTDGTVRGNVTALVGCELRHQYLLDHLMEKYFEGVDFDTSINTRFMVANHLFLKRFNNKELYLLAIKDLPKEKVDALVDYLNTADEIIPSTIDRSSPQYLSLRFNTPAWIIKMWQKQYGMGLLIKVLKTNYRHSIPAVRINTSVIDSESFFRKYVDFAPSGVEGIAFYNGKGSPKQLKEFHDYTIFFMRTATKYVIDRLEIEPMRGVAIYSEMPNNIHLDMMTRFDNKLHMEMLTNHYPHYLDVKKSLEHFNYPKVAIYEAGYSSLITCLAEPVGTVFCLPKSSGLDLLRSAPDYFLRIKQDQLDGLIANELASLQECAKFVEVGGSLVYMVATICKKESSGLIGTFLFNNQNYELVEERQFFPFDSYDSCLYYAILRRTGE